LVDDTLGERVAEPHHHRALDLAFDALRVDRAADVVSREVAQHVDTPGLGIGLEIDGVAPVGEVGEHAPAPGRLALPGIPAGSTPSTSAASWTSEEAWPPPMSGTPIRRTRVPSSSNPTHALDQSLSQTQRP